MLACGEPRFNADDWASENITEARAELRDKQCKGDDDDESETEDCPETERTGVPITINGNAYTVQLCQSMADT